MSKIQTRFVCQECGRISARMMGRCPQCGAYGSMVEEVISAAAAEPSRSTGRGLGGGSQPVRLTEIKGEVEERMPLPIGEFARVLGGGVVPGSIVLVGGDPGIGKSTLMLQMAMEMTKRSTVLYVSGEESERQIKMRALRLLRLGNDDGSEAESKEMPNDLYLVTETNLERILEHIASVKPDLVIIELDPDRIYPRNQLDRRVRHPGARVLGAPARAGQGLRNSRFRDRARHQRGHYRRAARP